MKTITTQFNRWYTILCNYQKNLNTYNQQIKVIRFDASYVYKMIERIRMEFYLQRNLIKIKNKSRFYNQIQSIIYFQIYLY
jgi:hypothetical protein